METVINKHLKSGTAMPTPPGGDNFYVYNNARSINAAGFLTAVEGHEYKGVGGSGNGHFAFLVAKEGQVGMDAQTEIEKNWDASSQTVLTTSTENEKDAISQTLWAAYFIEPTGNWGPGSIYVYDSGLPGWMIWAQRAF